MNIFAAIALFEAGYIFKERNGKFIPKINISTVKNKASNYRASFIKKHEEQKWNITVKDIKFDTKDDAWLVLDRMNEDIDRYGLVRLYSFYDYSGISHSYDPKDFSTGWKDLSCASPMLDVNGYWFIDLPVPINLYR